MGFSLNRLSIVVLVLISIMAFSLVACSNNNNNTDSGSDVLDMSQEELSIAYEDLGYDNDTTNSLEEIKQEQILMQKKDSFNKIDEALESGNLDETQANTLRLIAGYNPEALPNNYKTDFTDEEQLLRGRSSLQEAEKWLEYNWDSLDEETKELLLPYYVEPDNPNSYLNQPSNAEKIVNSVSVIPSAEAAIVHWKYFNVSTGIGAEIHYQNDAEKTQANWVDKAFSKAYVKHKQLLGIEPSEKVFIYIEPISDWGLESTRHIEGKNRCRIKIRKGLTEKQTKSTTAHELFHCFQDQIPLKYQTTAQKWLLETTATWAENYVYEDYDVEHRWLNNFFDNLNNKLVHYGDRREYGTYVWQVFVQQKLGKDKIKKMLFDAKNMAYDKAATTNLENFDDNFREYMIWNWNRVIAKEYKDHGNYLPEDPLWRPPHNHQKMSKNQEEPFFVILDPLSMYYNSVIFDDNTKKINIKFDKVGDEKHQVWALIKKNGAWHFEDWTKEKEKTFCQRDDDKIRTIVIMSDNSDSNADYSNMIKINTKGECEPRWRGTTTINWDHTEKSSAETLGGDSATKTSTTKGNIIINEELEIDEYDDANIRKISVSYQGDKLHRVDYDRDCSYLWEYDEDVYSGSKTFNFEDEEYPPTRWKLNDYPEDATGIEFNPSFFTNDKFITITNTKAYMLKDCGWGLGYGATEGLHEDTLTLNMGRFDFDYFELPIIPDEDTPVKGSHDIQIYSDEWGNYKVHVDYSYKYS